MSHQMNNGLYRIYVCWLAERALSNQLVMSGITPQKRNIWLSKKVQVLILSVNYLYWFIYRSAVVGKKCKTSTNLLCELKSGSEFKNSTSVSYTTIQANIFKISLILPEDPKQVSKGFTLKYRDLTKNLGVGEVISGLSLGFNRCFKSKLCLWWENSM